MDPKAPMILLKIHAVISKFTRSKQILDFFFFFGKKGSKKQIVNAERDTGPHKRPIAKRSS
jgi:hypothetical protein